MKLMVNEDEVRETPPPMPAVVRTILPMVWEVAEWNPELISTLPECDDKPRIIDCELMNYSKENPELSLRLFDPDPALVYSIDNVERLARVPRRTILLYCRHGLVSPVADPKSGGYCFDRKAIRVLQRIGYLQAIRGVNLAGIKFILELTEEVERLRATPARYSPATQRLNSGRRE